MKVPAQRERDLSSSIALTSENTKTFRVMLDITSHSTRRIASWQDGNSIESLWKHMLLETFVEFISM